MTNFSLSRVGLDTGQLLDQDILYIEQRVREQIRAKLVARQMFAPVQLPNAGVRTWQVNKMSDMSQARIDMDGFNTSFDRTKKTAHTVNVPVIHKEALLPWRDVIASRSNGMPIDVTEAQNAGIQVAEEEDKLLLTGEYTGWRALGIEGLATATGRNTQASNGTWATPANIILDLSNAIGKLEEDGFQGPYAFVLRSAWAAKLRQLVANTATTVRSIVDQNVKAVYVSDNLYTSAGAITSGLVVQPGEDNFCLGIAQEATVFTKQDDDMNTKIKVYECVVPHIVQAESICELTGLS